MSGDDAVGMVISILIAAYLVYVLINPERV
jgi:K+-transporting ATPase KdpF subunit